MRAVGVPGRPRRFAGPASALLATAALCALAVERQAGAAGTPPVMLAQAQPLDVAPPEARQLPPASGDAGTGASPGRAELPTTTAAVVDFQRILSDSKAAKSINDQIDARRKTYLDELSSEEQRLFETDKAIARQRSVLAPDVFAQKRREFEREVQEAQRLSQERRQQLEQARGAALGKVRQSVVEVVDELAKSRGFNLVLPSSAVLLFAPDIDLTNQVLALLDLKLPRVEVPASGD